MPPPPPPAPINSGTPGILPPAVQLLAPVDPAAVLDASVPLAHAFAPPAPPVGHAPVAAEPPAHAVSLAMPVEHEHEHEHPASLAMPVQHAQHPEQAYAPAMPSFHDTMAQPAHDVEPASDLGDPAASADAPHAPAASGSVLLAPATALMLAMFALAWQLVSYYARVQLPGIESSGGVLDRFDVLVGALPLLGSTLGPIIGAMLGAGALVLVFLGARRGVREPVLQGAVGLLGALALLAPVALPKLFG